MNHAPLLTTVEQERPGEMSSKADLNLGFCISLPELPRHSQEKADFVFRYQLFCTMANLPRLVLSAGQSKCEEFICKSLLTQVSGKSRGKAKMQMLEPLWGPQRLALWRLLADTLLSLESQLCGCDRNRAPPSSLWPNTRRQHGPMPHVPPTFPAEAPIKAENAPSALLVWVAVHVDR